MAAAAFGIFLIIVAVREKYFRYSDFMGGIFLLFLSMCGMTTGIKMLKTEKYIRNLQSNQRLKSPAKPEGDGREQ